MANKPYDIVVFGATGFTGELTAKHLATCSDKNKIKWAIAGRSKHKLDAVSERLSSLTGDHPDIGVIEADVNDYKSLKHMASQTRVLITTVGPYLNYGENVVKACVEAGTHYVDLTGEPEFVDSMIHLYDEVAEKKKIKIVNCCGFDSIPHDLGALFTINALNRLLTPEQIAQTPIICEGFVQAGGTFSGGTWHSAVTQFSRIRQYAKKKRAWRSAHPKTKSTTSRKVSALPFRLTYRDAFRAWACPFPTIDPVVVRRTAKKREQYGPHFQYGHYVLIKQLPTVIAGTLGMGGVLGLSQFSKTKDLLLKLKDPGEGPNEAERENGWFKVRMIASAQGLCVWSEISGGDPGYGETSKMLAESALCLALDEDSTPPIYGVVTPGAAMGESLITRLQDNGIAFKVISS